MSGTQLINIGLTVDTLNRLTALTRNYGTSPALAVASTAYTYDDANRVTNLQHVDASSANIANYTYTYDAAGNQTTETRNSTTTTYTYDATNQLTGDGTFSPTYDANGNRTNTGYTVGTDNQLTSDGTWNYAYDNEGNETSKTISSTGETWTYAYSQRNELTTASHKPSTLGAVDLTATYKYDALGNRIETDVWTSGVGTVVTKFALDGWKHANGHLVGNENWDVWADLDGSGSLKTRYLRGDVVDQLFARIQKSGSTWTPYWTLTDHLGSVREVIDDSASLVDTIAYSAFGVITSETNSAYRGRYAWTGRELDVETGLQFNRARYYDAATGRWISQDPMGFDAGDSNLERYVKNSPEVKTDPSGLDAPGTPWDEWGGGPYRYTHPVAIGGFTLKLQLRYPCSYSAKDINSKQSIMVDRVNKSLQQISICYYILSLPAATAAAKQALPDDVYLKILFQDPTTTAFYRNSFKTIVDAAKSKNTLVYTLKGSQVVQPDFILGTPMAPWIGAVSNSIVYPSFWTLSAVEQVEGISHEFGRYYAGISGWPGTPITGNPTNNIDAWDRIIQTLSGNYPIIQGQFLDFGPGPY